MNDFDGNILPDYEDDEFLQTSYYSFLPHEFDIFGLQVMNIQRTLTINPLIMTSHQDSYQPLTFQTSEDPCIASQQSPIQESFVEDNDNNIIENPIRSNYCSDLSITKKHNCMLISSFCHGGIIPMCIDDIYQTEQLCLDTNMSSYINSKYTKVRQQLQQSILATSLLSILRNLHHTKQLSHIYICQFGFISKSQLAIPPRYSVFYTGKNNITKNCIDNNTANNTTNNKMIVRNKIKNISITNIFQDCLFWITGYTVLPLSLLQTLISYCGGQFIMSVRLLDTFMKNNPHSVIYIIGNSLSASRWDEIKKIQYQMLYNTRSKYHMNFVSKNNNVKNHDDNSQINEQTDINSQNDNDTIIHENTIKKKFKHSSEPFLHFGKQFVQLSNSSIPQTKLSLIHKNKLYKNDDSQLFSNHKLWCLTELWLIHSVLYGYRVCETDYMLIAPDA